jgi:hypothetical protein
MVYSPVSATAPKSGIHTQAALAAATDDSERFMPTTLTGSYAGLIEIEPRSELAWITCEDVALSPTVTVDVPT